MTTARKSIMREKIEKYVRAWNGEPTLAFEVFSKTSINHMAWRSLDQGPQGCHDLIVAVRSSFPDLVMTLEDTVESENRLFGRVKIAGTHLGQYGQIPPTGKRVSWMAMAAFWFKDGMVEEEWSVANEVVLLSQLGVEMPTPAVARVS